MTGITTNVIDSIVVRTGLLDEADALARRPKACAEFDPGPAGSSAILPISSAGGRHAESHFGSSTAMRNGSHRGRTNEDLRQVGLREAKRQPDRWRRGPDDHVPEVELYVDDAFHDRRWQARPNRGRLDRRHDRLEG